MTNQSCDQRRRGGRGVIRGGRLSKLIRLCCQSVPIEQEATLKPAPRHHHGREGDA